jgi:hypothetical protein
VTALEGFVDAGSGVRLLKEALLATGQPRTLARFDADQLVDYRYRRPLLTFERDHWSSLALPQIELSALTDTSGTGFLLLHGVEPDAQWQRFAAAVELVARELDVRLVLGLDAVPLAVPHTRPLGLSLHASEPALREGHLPWFDTALVPGSAAHVIEHQLAEHGIPTGGFAVHVPQYLAQADYPQASLRLAEALTQASGLTLDLTSLAAAAAVVADRVAAEAAGSTEIQEMIGQLEQQYDAYLRNRSEDAALPSGDELGAELERFLSEQSRRDDG